MLEKNIRFRWHLIRPLAVLMGGIVIVNASAVGTRQKETFQDLMNEAEMVVYARIVHTQSHEFEKGGEREECGTNYTVQVLESIKGSVHGNLVFAESGSPLFRGEPVQIGT